VLPQFDTWSTKARLQPEPPKPREDNDKELEESDDDDIMIQIQSLMNRIRNSTRSRSNRILICHRFTRTGDANPRLLLALT
jgi:hypothetical protein